ncbi:MAG: STN domain-containing protein [Chitinophagales bacterium]|nr:STN domain-containing protein [Chitinophagales bacterium]
MKRLFILLPLWGIALSLTGQSLQQNVSFSYTGERLDAVLADISQTYQVRFSYSPDFIPVDRKVNVEVDNKPLSTALDDICEQVPMRYAPVGGQILLKPDRSRETKQLGQLNTRRGKVRQTSPIYPEPMDKAERERLRKMLSPIEQADENLVIEGEGNDLKNINTAPYRLPLEEYDTTSGVWGGDQRLAQISLLPFLGTNTIYSEEITNNVSVNVLWGTNGGVDGVEIGGLVNNVKNDVAGMQIAGLGNTVGGDVEGTQVGGLFNVNKGKTSGVQIAGLVNKTKEGHAVQAAGLANLVEEDYLGLQLAGLFNKSGGKAEGTQVAGLFNTSYDTSGNQLAGIFNNAGDVNGFQISGIFNSGRKVNGFQIGLINVSDTISGTPIGLLNIVKRGYNKVEVGVHDILYANLALKLGSHKFYNIFHLGARWDKLKPGQPDVAPGTYMSWGIGYGIGRANILGPRVLMNTELVAIQINEQEYWTNELNLLNQARLIFDFHKADGRLSFYVGPVANVMVSKIKDAETGEIGSPIVKPSYTLLEGSDEQTDVKMWVSLQAGIRF